MLLFGEKEEDFFRLIRLINFKIKMAMCGPNCEVKQWDFLLNVTG